MEKNQDDTRYIGVDIGGTCIKMGLFTSDGTLAEKWSIPTNLSDHGSYILPDIAASIQNKIKDVSLNMQCIAGVGVGVPGPVNEYGIVTRCVNLGWDVINVTQILEDSLDVPVRAGNDANVAALGEMYRGGGQGYNNLVMVTLGTGVGGGIIIDGKILNGVNGSGGEIGHIHMKDDETDACGCGNHGCLEQYASANGIVKLTKQYLKLHSSDSAPTTLRDISSLSCEDIFKAAKEGDSVAVMMVDQVCDYLGRALACVSAVVNPEVFVIGGGMSHAGDFLIQKIQSRYQSYAFHAARETGFHLAKLGNDAGIYGGVRLALND